ncbi:MAG TPA: pilus assembly protein TadG-related protein [Polyangia bacterium]|nr:pilus assembly protein TadG-related protein [Polyangia bacterium]
MRSTRRQAQSRNGERGAVAVMAAILMMSLFGFFALAFSMGTMMDTATDLQSASDSAALAAARSLTGDATGLTAARQAAVAYSQKHTAFGDIVTIDPYADVLFGSWSCPFGVGSCFVPQTDPRKITAVKILNGRNGGTHNSPVPLSFGAFVGASTASLASSAVAVGGGPSGVKCALPLVVDECQTVLNGANQLRCGTQTVTFSNANQDHIGFVNLDSSSNNNPNGTWVAGQITSKNYCNGSNRVGNARMQNGNDFDKVAAALAGTDGKKKGDPKTDCYIGSTQTVAVTDAGCPTNPSFQGTPTNPVVGFVSVIIAGVTDNKGNSLSCTTGVPGPTLPTTDMNAVVFTFPCSSPDPDTDNFGGGRAYNISNLPIRLAQ